jgi:hypothetical protein
MAMRRFELDDLVNRPGTYINPQTEVLLVIDDSTSIDGEIFADEDFESTEWVLVSEEIPVDEPSRDELLEAFSARHATAAEGLIELEDDEEDLDADDDFEGSGFDVKHVEDED